MKNKDKKPGGINIYPNVEISRPYLKIEPFKEFQKEAEIVRRKNASSLQAYELNKQRMKRIEAAYRNMSEKKLRTKSNERKSHPSGEQHLKIPIKSFNSITISSHLPRKNNRQSNETKRLFIRSKQKAQHPNYHPHHGVSLDLEKDIKNLKSKFEQVLIIDSAKIFFEEFSLLHDFLKIEEDEQKPLRALVTTVNSCWKKAAKINWEKWEHQRKLLMESVHQMQNKLNEQVKITEQLKNYCWNLQLQILKHTNKFFLDKEVQVELNPTFQDKSTNTEQIKNNETIDLIKKVRQYEKRQKQLLSVLYILKKDGINIEKAYEQVCRRQKQIFSQKSSEQSCQRVGSPSIKKHIKQKKKLQYTQNSEYDADNSIIDDIDGLSFNYQTQQPSLEAYSPKRVYKCSNTLLTQQLKQKLKLDLNCMYEDDSEALSGNGSLPTV